MRDISSPLDGFSSPFGPQRNRTLQSLLFGQTEPGFTFEPWDITTLYQDRAGTTPVTAAGQSVGLRLDKSKGLALGPELVTNGDFAAGATGWTDIVGAWAVTAGALVGTGIVANAYGPYSDNTSVVAGKFYRATFDVTVSSGSLLVRVGNDQSSGYASSGTFTRIFQAVSSGVTVFQSRAGSAGFTGSIDNISVRELAGNHEVAINDAKRGIYGWMPKTGRRNLLTYTEQFDNAVWSKSNATVTANYDTDLDGSITADRFVSSGGSFPQIFQTLTLTAGQAYTFSAWVKSDGTSQIAQALLLEGVVTAFTPTSTWTRVSVSIASSAGGSRSVVVATNSPVAAASSFLIWGAQLEIGSTATAYQRVNSQYDVTEAGVPTCYYVQPDGVDDAYVTPTITPGTDKVQVFAGVRKLSNSTGIILETGFNSGSFGAFYFATDTTPSNNFTYAGRGARTGLVADAANAASVAPASAVLTAQQDINSGNPSTIRKDGSLAVSSISTTFGGGNFLAYQAYIYGRGGTSLPFNGLDFGHAVRFGPNLDDATIARVEALIARNTPEVDFMFGGVWTDQYNWDDETNWNDGA